MLNSYNPWRLALGNTNDGSEWNVEVILSLPLESHSNRQYIIFTDANFVASPSGTPLYAAILNEDASLSNIEDESVWDMLDQVLSEISYELRPGKGNEE